MIDWNGNGRIDPVDIGISIVTKEAEKTDNADEEIVADEEMRPPNANSTGCLTSILLAVSFVIVWGILFQL